MQSNQFDPFGMTPARAEKKRRPQRRKAGPGPGRPTRLQIEERNQELLDHALDLFLEQGFERTTIREITASVGMAKRTVALRYGDKTSLFKAALKRAIDEWIVPVDRLRAAEADDLEQTLLNVARILVTNIMSPAGLRLMRIANTESYRMPEIGAYTYEQGTRPTIAYLADLFQRRLSNGKDFSDAHQYAEFFMNLVVGSPARSTVWGMPLDAADVERRTERCVHLFLRGVLER
jgi:AcrR family transcriptional regulator